MPQIHSFEGNMQSHVNWAIIHEQTDIELCKAVVTSCHLWSNISTTHAG